MSYDKNTNYTELWVQDKQSVIATMQRNMSADLSCGYDPCGASIRNQLADISAYTAEYHRELMELAERKNPNYWAYLDMVRRGTIEA